MGLNAGDTLRANDFVSTSSGAGDVNKVPKLDSNGKIPDGFVYLPTGGVMPYAGSSAPTGWVLCDGSSYLRTGTYAALFAIIGTTYGSVDGTHFNVPDLRGRVAVGKSTDTEFDTLGETGGEKTHTLTVGEMPSHTHTINRNTAASSYGFSYSSSGSGGATALSGSTGGDGAHNNLQPYITLNYIIKL